MKAINARGEMGLIAKVDRGRVTLERVDDVSGRRLGNLAIEDTSEALWIIEQLTRIFVKETE